MRKYCTKCGKPFDAVGREVICPACKQAAAEETKRAAVLRAKRASWAGESVPVRISGRASAVVRRYGADHGLPCAAALDALLQASSYFGGTGKAWEDIEPYRSHRRDKHTTPDAPDTPDTPPDTPPAAKAASKPQDKPQGKPASRQGKPKASK